MNFCKDICNFLPPEYATVPLPSAFPDPDPKPMPIPIDGVSTGWLPPTWLKPVLVLL
jgi:hypothetical protein